LGSARCSRRPAGAVIAAHDGTLPVEYPIGLQVFVRAASTEEADLELFQREEVRQQSGVLSERSTWPAVIVLVLLVLLAGTPSRAARRYGLGVESASPVRGADQRPRHHPGEADLLGLGLEADELVGLHPPDNRVVPR
jgi:hypothetical protein